ncbi:MAG: Glycoprotein gp2 [Elusimicrobia bacterium]|nr:MAG: Glycoprotein gp2 [Elusimicrobiota bacterium]
MPAALRTPSSLPGCAVTAAGNVITFLGWDLDWQLYGEIPVDSTWYIYNFTRSEAKAITAKSGAEATGYSVTVAAIGTWVSGDLCLILPNTFAAVTTHATWAALVTAAAANDTVIQGYASSTTKQTVFYAGCTMGVKPLNIYGHLSRGRCASAWYSISGDQTGLAQVMIRNVTAAYGPAGYVFLYNDSGVAKTGGGVIWDRCATYSAPFGATGFFVQNGANNVCTARFCAAYGGTSGFLVSVPAYFYHCIALYCNSAGFTNSSIAATYTNCAGYKNATDFGTKTNGIYTTCASFDATGTAGLLSLTEAQFAWWSGANNLGHYDQNANAGITTASSLHNAGTFIAGLTKDRDGATIGAGTTPVGILAGTVNAYGVTWPTAAQTQLAVTFQTFAASVTGTLATSPAVAISLILDAATYAIGATATVTGGVTSNQNVTGATVTLLRKKKSDGSTVATLINTTTNLVATVQKTWASILGAACTFAPATAQLEYLEATVSGGTPTITSETAGQAPYAVRSAAATITAVRISETTIRLTVAGSAAGITARSYYSTKAAAGSPWTAGLTCDGNSTIDITVLAGTTYFIFVLLDSGTWSVASNLIEMSSAVGSGGSLIARLGFPRLKVQPKVASDDTERTVLQCIYDLGPGGTLANCDLEVGDFLPANADNGITGSTYEIISARLRKVRGSVAEEAVVTGELLRPWED